MIAFEALTVGIERFEECRESASQGVAFGGPVGGGAPYVTPGGNRAIGVVAARAGDSDTIERFKGALVDAVIAAEFGVGGFVLAPLAAVEEALGGRPGLALAGGVADRRRAG